MARDGAAAGGRNVLEDILGKPSFARLGEPRLALARERPECLLGDPRRVDDPECVLEHPPRHARGVDQGCLAFGPKVADVQSGRVDAD
jgi:hypothetical protein